jgi:hypothetical integral membrane protein (TIGR02206 family)
MDLSFLYQEGEFTAFSNQHYYPLLIIAIVGFVAIKYAKSHLNQSQQWRFLFLLSLIPPIGYMIALVAVLLDGSFLLKDDLPVHICRILAFMTPIIILYRNRFWMGVIYFWIIVGTLNANITPDIEYGFPNYGYFSYWMMHGFLVLIPLYYVIVLGIRIKKKDIWNAFWTANVYVIFSLIINYILDSNYMYTMHKPPVTTLLSYMGEWPYYLLSVQLLGLFLFCIAYLPFLIIRR